MAEAGDRSQPATPRRQNEARQGGNIARSHDLTAAATLTTGIIVLRIFGMRIFEGLHMAVESTLAWGFSGNPTRPGDTSTLEAYCVSVLVRLAGPVILLVASGALLVTLAQVGFIFTLRPLEFNLAKLSPLRGLGNVFNIRSTFRLGMNVIKLAVVGTVAGVLIWQQLPRIMMLTELELLPMFSLMCDVVYGVALKLALLLVVLALADYVYQRWQRNRDLRMTRQEIKEELRRMEGDPQMKSRRARVARQLALQRINQAVPKADVVVTNPTHYAVAMSYDSATMKAPKVVAKGADYLAMRIRQLATASGVPLVERKALAQALYKTVEVGQEVPQEHYNAVAEILAYVYRLSGRKTA